MSSRAAAGFSDRTAAYLASGRPALVAGNRHRRQAAAGRGIVDLRDSGRGGSGVRRILSPIRSAMPRRLGRLAVECLDSDRVPRRAPRQAGDWWLTVWGSPSPPSPWRRRRSPPGSPVARLHNPTLRSPKHPRSSSTGAGKHARRARRPTCPRAPSRDAGARSSSSCPLRRLPAGRAVAGAAAPRLPPGDALGRKPSPRGVRRSPVDRLAFHRDGRTIWALRPRRVPGQPPSGPVPERLLLPRCTTPSPSPARATAAAPSGRSLVTGSSPAVLSLPAWGRLGRCLRADQLSSAAPTASTTRCCGARPRRPARRLPGGTRAIGSAGSWRAWGGHGFSVRFGDPYRGPHRRGCRAGWSLPDRIAEMTESLTFNTVLGRYLLIGLAPPGPLSVGPQDLGHLLLDLLPTWSTGPLAR